MKTFDNILLYLFCSLIGFQLSYAQTVQHPLKINNTVGTSIDLKEKQQYGLFNEYSDEEFVQARFFTNKNNPVILVIYKTDGQTDTSKINIRELKAIKKVIEKKKSDFSNIDTAYVYSIELTDKCLLYGTVTEISDSSITIQSESTGTQIIAQNRIVNIEKQMPVHEYYSNKWFENPHASRLLFAPTAIPLKKGEGYLQDIYIFGVFANYGATDNILIGGGISIIPFIGLQSQILFLNPKVSFEVKENMFLGGGVFYASAGEEETLSRQHFGIAYATGTYGNRNNNITAGIGYGNFNGNFNKRPLAMLGGMYRFSRRTAFVSENWFMSFNNETENGHPENQSLALVSYGLRFFSKKLCLDFAFFNVIGEAGPGEFYVPGIPYIDFVVKL